MLLGRFIASLFFKLENLRRGDCAHMTLHQVGSRTDQTGSDHNHTRLPLYIPLASSIHLQ